MFSIFRGCRQGDPISPYLFIFFAEILGMMIRNNAPVGNTVWECPVPYIQHFVDDTTCILDESERCLHAVLQVLNCCTIPWTKG